MYDPVRQKIRSVLDGHRIMTVATVRPDGWPQATTVGYVTDETRIYFLCGNDSQKARNIALDDRISVTIDHDTARLMEIAGLSMAAHARRVTDREEAISVLQKLPLKYPEQPKRPGPMPGPEDVAIYEVVPVVVSVLDYTKGFGPTDLLTY